MAVWTSVKGTVKVNKGASLSIKKLTQLYIYGSEPTITKEEINNYWVYSVCFNFIEDGLESATLVDKWVAAMTEGWGASVDINADIRWYC